LFCFSFEILPKLILKINKTIGNILAMERELQLEEEEEEDERIVRDNTVYYPNLWNPLLQLFQLLLQIMMNNLKLQLLKPY